jgi:hypothetical protein
VIGVANPLIGHSICLEIHLKQRVADLAIAHAERRGVHPPDLLADILEKVLSEDLIEAVIDDE